MSESSRSVLRLGTRGSLLARAQSGMIAAALERTHPGLQVEITVVRTTGDQIADRPLHEVGGKGLFTKELELGLLSESIDLAVHSYKDVPVTMPLVDGSDLVMAAVPPREDPRDVLVSAHPTSIRDLPAGARVGTGSLRRRCQLLQIRRDLRVESIRGNIDTRLKKRAAGEFDAVVLAIAGLKRAGLYDPTTAFPLTPQEMLPAPGQGVLALQCRRADAETRRRLTALNHPPTATCVNAERRLVQLLEGDCHSPIAALAEMRGDRLILRAAVGARDGAPPVISASAESNADAPGEVARIVAEDLIRQGARELLQSRG